MTVKHLTIKDTMQTMYDDCSTTISSIDTATGWSNTGDYYTHWDYGIEDMSKIIQISGALDLNGMDVGKEINEIKNKLNEKEKENMMYLWEVILVNPKTDDFEAFEVTAKSETSALMVAYGLSQVENSDINGIEFDDLVSQCNVEMEWVKEKSLTKAIKTIQEAVK